VARLLHNAARVSCTRKQAWGGQQGNIQSDAKMDDP
jgi:hypothetical protein